MYAQVSVGSEGTIFVASHDHHLYAVGPDGKEIWSYDAGGKIWATPAIGVDQKIYVGSDADRLVALDRTGQEHWVFPTAPNGSPRGKVEAGRWDLDTSPLLASDGTVIFGCHTTIFALWPSGKKRWSFSVGEGKKKIFSSPSRATDGTIYFGTQGNTFFALSSDGALRWQLKTGGDNDSTPVVGDDGTVYFASDDGLVRAVAPGGNLRWRADLGHPIRAPLALGWDGTLYASTVAEQPFLAALDCAAGREKWRFSIRPGQGAYYGIQSGALVDGEGYIYFGAGDHFIYCLSPTGKLVWSYETGDQVDSGPSLGADGTLYVGSDDHQVYAFARKGHDDPVRGKRL